MKRVIIPLLLCMTLLFGCSLPKEPAQKQYTATFLSLFDTVTTVKGNAQSEADFRAKVQPLREALEHYHQLFDIYHTYDGFNNLCTVNEQAGVAPVAVDVAILDLLDDCKRYDTLTNGLFNPAMGSVLSLWHEARTDGIKDPQNAYLPDTQALQEAALHADPDDIILDRENGTVFLADPAMRLDVGGIAKGWAVQRVVADAPEGLLISVGGNVYATGPKDDAGSPWAVGIQNPDGSSRYLHILNITCGSVVTSGSYHRAYTVDGKLYHHIIDPRTLFPGELWTSVSVVCQDSGLADVLSTSLFLLEQAAGEALLAQFEAEAMWVDTAGHTYYSSGFQDLIRN